MQEHHLVSQAGRILVAAEGSTLAGRIRDCLSRDGHLVRTAAHPDDADLLLESERFDFIVIESSLPPARVLAILEEARRQRPSPVVFLVAAEESLPNLLATVRLTAAAASQESEQELLQPSLREPLPMTLDAVERAHILQVLRLCRGNKKKTAAMLGINRSSLYGKLKRFGITVAAKVGDASREMETV